MTTTIFLQGALDAIETNEPLGATMLNMSAAANNNLLFFSAMGTDGKQVMVAIPKVLYMRDNGDD